MAFYRVRLGDQNNREWGALNKLRVNEKIKTDIEKRGLKGVELTRIKSPECILKSEYAEMKIQLN